MREYEHINFNGTPFDNIVNKYDCIMKNLEDARAELKIKRSAIELIKNSDLNLAYIKYQEISDMEINMSYYKGEKFKGILGICDKVDEDFGKLLEILSQIQDEVHLKTKELKYDVITSEEFEQYIKNEFDKHLTCKMESYLNAVMTNEYKNENPEQIEKTEDNSSANINQDNYSDENPEQIEKTEDNSSANINQNNYSDENPEQIEKTEDNSSTNINQNNYSDENPEQIKKTDGDNGANINQNNYSNENPEQIKKTDGDNGTNINQDNQYNTELNPVAILPFLITEEFKKLDKDTQNKILEYAKMEKLPENWDKTIEAAKEKAASGDYEKIEQAMKSIKNERNNAELSYLTDLKKENYESIEAYKNKQIEDLKADLKTDNKAVLTEYLKKANLSEDEIKNTIESMQKDENIINQFVDKKIENEINKRNESSEKYVAGIIDAVYGGNKEDGTGKTFDLSYQDNKDYYTKAEEYFKGQGKEEGFGSKVVSYAEINSNYSMIRQDKDAVETLKGIFGEEFINTLEQPYQS